MSFVEHSAGPPYRLWWIFKSIGNQTRQTIADCWFSVIGKISAFYCREKIDENTP